MMNSKLSYKQKLIVVSLTIGLLFWVAFHFTVSKTMTLWKENQKLEMQQAQIIQIPEQLPIITQKVEQLEKVLGKSGEEEFSSQILERINVLCEQNNLQLSEIPEKHLFEGNHVNVETIMINLQGNFINLLSACAQLERKESKTRIRSVKFRTNVHPVTGARKLMATLYLQSIHLDTIHTNTSDYEKSSN